MHQRKIQGRHLRRVRRYALRCIEDFAVLCIIDERLPVLRASFNHDSKVFPFRFVPPVAHFISILRAWVGSQQLEAATPRPCLRDPLSSPQLLASPAARWTVPRPTHRLPRGHTLTIVNLVTMPENNALINKR